MFTASQVEEISECVRAHAISCPDVPLYIFGRLLDRPLHFSHRRVSTGTHTHTGTHPSRTDAVQEVSITQFRVALLTGHIWTQEVHYRVFFLQRYTLLSGRREKAT